VTPDVNAARGADERRRILDAYAARRARVAAGDVDPLRYTSWTPGYLVAHQLVERRVLQMLWACGMADLTTAKVLDVGSGDGVIGESEGVHLHELIKYGAMPGNLHGVDLQEEVVRRGRQLHPGVTLTSGSAEALPYEDASFDLVCQSTVFSSILDPGMRRRVAVEMRRVLRPQGLILWYDFRRNNPLNHDIRRVTRAEVRALFPGCAAWFRTSTLAHPIARPLARVSPVVVQLLELVRPLRTHELAIITPDPARLAGRRRR
jgi:ubiquinone/menaquinone biosynthesis C-methylase UbiE